MTTETPSTELIRIDQIHVPERLRPINPKTVADIADSISRIGLRTPIDVCRTDHGKPFRLVARLHRLNAVKTLGIATIEARVREGDEEEMRMWQIIENLHRADLTTEQRDAHFRALALVKEAKGPGKAL